MLKKLLTAGVLACAALGTVAPAASAATRVFAGVYPSWDAAWDACADGQAQGRWKSCTVDVITPGHVGLWVFV